MRNYSLISGSEKYTDLIITILNPHILWEFVPRFPTMRQLFYKVFTVAQRADGVLEVEEQINRRSFSWKHTNGGRTVYKSSNLLLFYGTMRLDAISGREKSFRQNWLRGAFLSRHFRTHAPIVLQALRLLNSQWFWIDFQRFSYDTFSLVCFRSQLRVQIDENRIFPFRTPLFHHSVERKNRRQPDLNSTKRICRTNQMSLYVFVATLFAIDK